MYLKKLNLRKGINKFFNLNSTSYITNPSLSFYHKFNTTATKFHGIPKLKPGEGIQIHFIDSEGERITVGAPEGASVLDVAHANNVDLEGACESSLACSTCHVILEQEVYDQLEEPSDEENDMLDLAFGLTETSRLGCQIIVKPELEGATFKIPSATRNMAVDGYKPKPH